MTTGKKFPRAAKLVQDIGWNSLKDVVGATGDREVLILSRGHCGCYQVQFPDDVEEKFIDVLKRISGIRRNTFVYVD